MNFFSPAEHTFEFSHGTVRFAQAKLQSVDTSTEAAGRIIPSSMRFSIKSTFQVSRYSVHCAIVHKLWIWMLCDSRGMAIKCCLIRSLFISALTAPRLVSFLLSKIMACTVSVLVGVTFSKGLTPTSSYCLVVVLTMSVCNTRLDMATWKLSAV